MDEFRDPAAEEARRLQEEQLKKVREGWTPDDEGPKDAEEGPTDTYGVLYKKIKYDWRAADKAALSQIRGAAAALIGEIFDDAFRVVDELYATVRVAETSGGRNVTDEHGRTVWKRDDRGRPIEDWDQLTGQDAEKALMDLSKIRLLTSQTVQDLFLEASLAKHSYNDSWYESYEGIVEGTGPIRTARANRDSLQDKYHAYFRFYLWSKADAFQKELSNLMRLLERIIDWRIRRR